MINLWFVSGVVGASYDKLLTPIQLKSFENLTEEAFLKLLNTYQYGNSSGSNLDQIMLGEELKLKDFIIANLGNDHVLVSILYLSFDQLFLSSIYKELILGIKPKNPPMDLSTFNEKAVRDFLTLGQDIYLDSRTKNILEKISTKVETLDAQGISDWVIQVLYETIIDELNQDKKSDSTVKKYLSELITIENILMILRSKRYQMGHTYVKENLISGGFIDLNILESLYDLSFSDIGNYLKLHYDDGVVEAFKDVNSSQFIKKIADAFDGYLFRQSEGYSYQAVGFGSLIDYVYKKRLEITKLKTLYYESAVNHHGRN